MYDGHNMHDEDVPREILPAAIEPYLSDDQRQGPQSPPGLPFHLEARCTYSKMSVRETLLPQMWVEYP